MKEVASLDEPQAFNPSLEPLCGLPPELWAKILSYLKGVDPLRLMQVSGLHRHLVATEFKLGKPLEGELSELLVQAARTNDTALVCRCFRIAAFDTDPKPFGSSLAHRLATEVWRRVKVGLDRSSAEFALSCLIRNQPEALYVGNGSLLQMVLRERQWALAHILLQCGVSINHKDRFDGAPAPIVTCLRSILPFQPSPSSLLDALLEDDLDLSALGHPAGSPAWLIVDFATEAQDYAVPEPFKKRFGDYLRCHREAFSGVRGPGVRPSSRGVCTPLHCLIDRGSVKWVKWYLGLGADPNEKDQHGRTPLSHCISFGVASVDARIAMAKALYAKGANLNARDTFGATALHASVECESPELTKWLAGLPGVDLNVQSSDSQSEYGTPLVVACIYRGKTRHARALLKAGASVLYVTRDNTPLLPLLSQFELSTKARELQALIMRKTRAELATLKRVEPCWLAPFSTEEQRELYEIVLEKTSHLNGVDGEGCTALGRWAAHLNWGRIDRLLNLGARVDVGAFPLHIALRAAALPSVSAAAILSGLWRRLLTEETAQGALQPLLSANWARFGKEAEQLQLFLCKEILKRDRALYLDRGFGGSPLAKAADFHRLDLVEAMLSAAYPDGIPSGLPWLEEAGALLEQLPLMSFAADPARGRPAGDDASASSSESSRGADQSSSLSSDASVQDRSSSTAPASTTSEASLASNLAASESNQSGRAKRVFMASAACLAAALGLVLMRRASRLLKL